MFSERKVCSCVNGITSLAFFRHNDPLIEVIIRSKYQNGAAMNALLVFQRLNVVYFYETWLRTARRYSETTNANHLNVVHVTLLQIWSQVSANDLFLLKVSVFNIFIYFGTFSVVFNSMQFRSLFLFIYKRCSFSRLSGSFASILVTWTLFLYSFIMRFLCYFMVLAGARVIDPWCQRT